MQQGTQEWFQARIGKVTASRVSDALASPSTAAYSNYLAQIIAERLTGELQEQHVTSAMQWGTDHEPEARAAYQFMSGNIVEDVGFVEHLIIKQSGASPDGLVGDDGQIEIKCPNTNTHIKTLINGVIDKKYRNQMTWQMACTDRKWCDFVSYDPRLPAPHNLCIIRFERDDEDVKKMELGIKDFLAEVSTKIEMLNNRSAGENA